jgi:hypothetical protein
VEQLVSLLQIDIMLVLAVLDLHNLADQDQKVVVVMEELFLHLAVNQELLILAAAVVEVELVITLEALVVLVEEKV